MSSEFTEDQLSPWCIAVLVFGFIVYVGLAIYQITIYF
jgi:hypothetical protein